MSRRSVKPGLKAVTDDRPECVIYCRISNDYEGRSLGVERQEELCRDLAERLGLRVVKVLNQDNDISASTLSTRTRPDYEWMLREIDAGRVTYVLSYSTSRLTRKPEEANHLIRLGKDGKVRAHTITSGELDFLTARGRRRIRDDSSRDTEEAETISELTRAKHAQKARAGEFSGGVCPFGYQAVREVVTEGNRQLWKVVRIEPHPEHSQWVKEALSRVLDGETIYSIIVSWNEAGRTTRKGEPWASVSLQRILLAPAIAGLRQHYDQTYPAQWPAIVDVDEWKRAREVIKPEKTGPNPWAGNGNARRHALSGLIYCDICKKRLYGGKRDGIQRWVCSRAKGGGCGGVFVKVETLEAFVMEQVFAFVDTAAFRRAVKRRQKDNAHGQDQIKSLSRAVTDISRRLEKVADDYYDEQMTKAEYTRQRDRLQKQLEEATAERDALIREQAAVSVPRGEILREMWPTEDGQWKRAILSQVIERVWVRPHPQGVARHLHPYIGEDPEDHKQRLDLHIAGVMAQRLTVDWLI